MALYSNKSTKIFQPEILAVSVAISARASVATRLLINPFFRLEKYTNFETSTTTASVAYRCLQLAHLVPHGEVTE